jgi:hypothetical protein
LHKNGINLLIRPSDGLEGSFKLKLSGSDHLAVRAPVNLVLPFEDLSDLELHGQFLPGHHIALQPNSTSSPWVDVEDLINAQDVDVFNKDGNPAHELVLSRLEEAREANPRMGNTFS